MGYNRIDEFTVALAALDTFPNKIVRKTASDAESIAVEVTLDGNMFQMQLNEGIGITRHFRGPWLM